MYMSTSVVTPPFGVPQHNIDGENDADLLGTVKPYDMRLWETTFEYTELGYLVKTILSHFMIPIPRWLQDVHDAYFNPTPVTARKKAARSAGAKPDSIITELENLSASLGYCRYTPEEIGRHLRTIFVEAFGEAIFQIGAAELEEGTVFCNNLRLYISLFGKGVMGSRFVEHELDDIADNLAQDETPAVAFIQTEASQFMASKFASSANADDGNYLSFSRRSNL
jgi:hypothetical protein